MRKSENDKIRKRDEQENKSWCYERRWQSNKQSDERANGSRKGSPPHQQTVHINNEG